MPSANLENHNSPDNLHISTNSTNSELEDAPKKIVILNLNTSNSRSAKLRFNNVIDVFRVPSGIGIITYLQGHKKVHNFHFFDVDNLEIYTKSTLEWVFPGDDIIFNGEEAKVISVHSDLKYAVTIEYKDTEMKVRTEHLEFDSECYVRDISA